MALVLKDRVKETTTTTGTGTVTLAGAVSGFQSFSTVGNGNTTYYTILGGTEWEVGIGTYTASGTTLSRDTVLASSNAGSLVSFSAGTKDVFVTYAADKAVTLDTAQALSNKTSYGLDATAYYTLSGGNPLLAFDSNDYLAYDRTANTFSWYVGGTLLMTIGPSASTVSGLTLNDGYTEEVYAVSGTTPALSPTNGSIQTWTLTGNSTPTAGTWAAGQSVTMMIADGTAYTVTWTSLPVTWVGGTAPTLPTSGYAVIELWKVGTTIYGASVGDVA